MCNMSWNLIRCATVLIVLTGVSACTSNRLAYDHRVMRDELLKLYDEQLMDNLIRAYNGQPLLQIKYGVIDGTSTTNAELSGTISDDDKAVINFGANNEFTDSDSTGGTGKVEITSEMKIAGTPVLNDQELIDEYRNFAEKFLQQTSDPPPHDAILSDTRQEWEKGRLRTMYYWVPRIQKRLGNREIDSKEELVKLTDRVMLDKKKTSQRGLPESADVIIKSMTLDRVEGIPALRTYNVWLKPSPGMSYGMLSITKKGKRKSIEYETATVNLLPDKVVVKAMLVPEACNYKLYVFDSEILKLKELLKTLELEKLKEECGLDIESYEQLVCLEKQHPDQLEQAARNWFEYTLKSSMQKLEYVKCPVVGVDLNELAKRLLAR